MLDRIITDRPEILFLAMTELALVHPVEQSQPQEFDCRPRPREKALEIPRSGRSGPDHGCSPACSHWPGPHIVKAVVSHIGHSWCPQADTFPWPASPVIAGWPVHLSTHFPRFIESRIGSGGPHMLNNSRSVRHFGAHAKHLPLSMHSAARELFLMAEKARLGVGIGGRYATCLSKNCPH